MKRLLIVGASGMGREVAEYARACFTETSWKYGFLDDRPNLPKGFESTLPPIVGAVESFKPQKDDFFLIALGEPNMRRKYVEMLTLRGAKFTLSLFTPQVFKEVA